MSDYTFKVVSILSALIIALGGLLVAASIWGADSSMERLIQYFGTAVPVMLGFAFTTNRQSKNDEATEDTRKNVSHLSSTLNGKLDARFERIEKLIGVKADQDTEEASSGIAG